MLGINEIHETCLIKIKIISRQKSGLDFMIFIEAKKMGLYQKY